jgi:predicted flap endonuclease-1-like 5' DNA nuclease
MNTNEKITNETIDFEEVIDEKLGAIIGKKYSENKDAVDRLGTIDDSWRSLNESLFKEITTRTDLVRSDKDAVHFVKNMLKEIRIPVTKKNAFVINGKIIDAKNRVGLPGMCVKILAPPEKNNLVLADIQADTYGNFTVTIGKDDIEIIGTKEVKLTFQVFLPSGKAVYSKDVSMKPWPGRNTQVILEIKSRDEEVKERLEAARALIDSVEGDEELVIECDNNIKEAHVNLTKLKDIGHDEIKTLKEELSIEPPEISFEYEEEEFEIEEGEEALETGEQVQAEEEEKQKQKAPEEIKQVPPIKLEDIKGIGPAAAKKLRDAGIKDVKAFSETDEAKLKEILGRVDIAKLKKESLSLLKKHEKDTPKQAKE